MGKGPLDGRPQMFPFTHMYQFILIIRIVKYFATKNSGKKSVFVAYRSFSYDKQQRGLKKLAPTQAKIGSF
jgi:hypothetical protein